MAGRPSAAAERAAKWLRAGHGTAAEAARKFGLSARQAQRIAAQVGLPAQPVGRPPVPRHAYGHDPDVGF